MGSAKASDDESPFSFQYGTLLLTPLYRVPAFLLIFDVVSGFDFFFSRVFV